MMASSLDKTIKNGLSAPNNMSVLIFRVINCEIPRIWHFIKIQYGGYTKMAAAELKRNNNGLSVPKNISVPIFRVIDSQKPLIMHFS
jgi:hypothetical protein